MKGAPMTTDDFSDLAAIRGRKTGTTMSVQPEELKAMRASRFGMAKWAQVIQWYRSGRLAPAELNSLMAEVWHQARYPAFATADFSATDIVQMFEAAGFVSDQPGAQPPTKTLWLYRGASRTDAFGLSWSPVRGVALALIWRALNDQFTDAVLCEALIEPHQVLGVFGGAVDGGQLHPEIIVDTRTLDRSAVTITPASEIDLPERLFKSMALMGSAAQAQRTLKHLQSLPQQPHSKQLTEVVMKAHLLKLQQQQRSLAQSAEEDDQTSRAVG